MKWTPNQDKAINLDNTNIIVSAGAGSGQKAYDQDCGRGGESLSQLLLFS